MSNGYALSNRLLRVKKDVSDLKLDLLFWERVLGKTIFSQLSKWIHPAAIPPLRGALSTATIRSKRFPCWDQFLCHGLRAVDFRESLADIEDCLARAADQLYRMGFRTVYVAAPWPMPTARDWRIYADLAAIADRPRPASLRR